MNSKIAKIKMGCHQSPDSIETVDLEVIYSNEQLFKTKLNNFLQFYKENNKSVAVISDFDFTITEQYDYTTKKKYKSSYYLYDEDIIGGDMQKFNENIKLLKEEYSKYEFDSSYPYDIRYQKMDEWYTKTLKEYCNEKFTLNSIDKMTEKSKNNILFRQRAKEYIELLLSMNITLIIISGGITQFIISALKLFLLPDIEKYIEEKKIVIISNSFVFDQKTKGCTGIDKEVIFCFNKAAFVSKVVNNLLPDLKSVLVLGDHMNDIDSVQKMNLSSENIISIRFLNITLDEYENKTKNNESIQSHIEESKKVYDLTFVGKCDYGPIIGFLKK